MLAQVINTLVKGKEENEYIEVELIEKNGSIIKKLLKKNKVNKEFQKNKKSIS